MRCIIAACDWSDVAVAECEIATINQTSTDIRFIPIKVKKFSIINCSFIVRLMAESTPAGSVIMGCADSRQSNIKRMPIAAYFPSLDLYFVGPNTGTITLLLEEYSPETIIRLTYDRWNNDQFIGRSLYSPTAAKLANGISIESLGTVISLEEINCIKISKYTILHIDNYGNIKINCKINELPLDTLSSIKVNGEPVIFVQNFRDKHNNIIDNGKLVITIGSSLGYIEIQRKAQDSTSVGAAKFLGVSIEEMVEINYT